MTDEEINVLFIGMFCLRTLEVLILYAVACLPAHKQGLNLKFNRMKRAWLTMETKRNKIKLLFITKYYCTAFFNKYAMLTFTKYLK